MPSTTAGVTEDSPDEAAVGALRGPHDPLHDESRARHSRSGKGSGRKPWSRSAGLGLWGPLGAAAVGGVLRLVSLGRPHDFVFDETYYAKDALSLLRFGYEQETIDDANEIILASDGDWRSLEVFTGEPAFVVHPPAGKWIIAMGEWGLGMTPTGWRIAVAILGTLAVFLLGRVMLRLTGNALLATIAAGLLALEGVSLVLSRVAVLDGILTFFVLLAFWALLRQRDRDRASPSASDKTPDANTLWIRPWWWVAGAALGIACSVKWSGLWFLLAFLALAALWQVSTLKQQGTRGRWLTMLRRDAPVAIVSIVGVAAITYLMTWTGWLVTDGGWSRQYGAESSSLIPQALRALWHYHVEIYAFHVSLAADHSYAASPWGWFVQARPTSMYYESYSLGPECGYDKCSAAVVALGNPVIWWAGTLALFHQVFRSVLVRDWRSSAVVVAVLAGWLPWLRYQDRTTFSFYSVVVVPFVIMALTLSLGRMLSGSGASARRRATGIVGVAAVLLATVLVAGWMYPVWTGQIIDFEQWQLRMWWPSWI